MEETTEISSGFIGNFNIKRNILRNLETLNLLYSYYNDETRENRPLIVKPMVLIIASCCEAILYDFNFRVKEYTFEGVPNIVKTHLRKIRNRSKVRDHFESNILEAKEFAILGENNESAYEDLISLKNLRNRIHIQNKNSLEPPLEEDAFRTCELEKAERLLEGLMWVMHDRHGRDSRPDLNTMGPFTLPWTSRGRFTE